MSDTAKPPAPRQGYLVVFIVLLAACLAVWLRLKYTPLPPPRTLPEFGPAPAFSLTERNGDKFSSEELKGKVWIADFIFTRCAGSCPLMSTQMRDLQESFAKSEQVRLVSFSVDPAHDTPEALNEYAARYMAKPGRWFFLAGKEGEVAKLAIEGFKLPAGESSAPADPSGFPDEPAILHSQRLVLVDGAGRVRGYYDGTGMEVVQKLVADVRALLRPGAKPVSETSK
jgi:protein SCO1/2